MSFAASEEEEDLNDTLTNYQAMRELEEEENYTVFCLAQDRMDSGNC